MPFLQSKRTSSYDRVMCTSAGCQGIDTPEPTETEYDISSSSFLESLEIGGYDDADSEVVDNPAHSKAAVHQTHHAPSNYYCPLTLELMDVPVMDTCGHCFEYDAIVAWLDNHLICPISRKPLTQENLKLAYELRARIQTWRAEHAHSSHLALDPTGDCEQLPSSYTTMERLLLPQERQVVGLLQWRQRLRTAEQQKRRRVITWSVVLCLTLAAAAFVMPHVYNWHWK